VAVQTACGRDAARRAGADAEGRASVRRAARGGAACRVSSTRGSSASRGSSPTPTCSTEGSFSGRGQPLHRSVLPTSRSTASRRRGSEEAIDELGQSVSFGYRPRRRRCGAGATAPTSSSSPKSGEHSCGSLQHAIEWVEMMRRIAEELRTRMAPERTKRRSLATSGTGTGSRHPRSCRK
jgi:hypothetical protein